MDDACPECGRRKVNPRFRELIRRAAAEAHDQITEVVEGRYHPRVEVMMQGEPLGKDPLQERNAPAERVRPSRTERDEMPDPQGYWWVPGDFRPDRGYTRQEAVASVGTGWAALAEAAWLIVTGAGGDVSQVKQKTGYLRVYWGGISPELNADVERAVLALEELSLGLPEGELAGDAASMREWVRHQQGDSSP